MSPFEEEKDPRPAPGGGEDGLDSRTKKRRNPDPGVWIQKYIEGSKSPEETLFKINEILFAEQTENTRKVPRAPLTVPVVFKVDGHTYKAATYTISQKGMFIKHPDPPASGVRIMVAFDLPDDSEEVEAEAEVLSSVSIEQATEKGVLSGMSVVFKKISSRDRKRIDKIVRAQARRMKNPER